MRRFTTIEMCAVGLGLLFVATGVFMIFYPADDLLIPPLQGKYGTIPIPISNQPEYLSNLGSQICGGIAVVIGAGITWAAFARGGK